MKPQELLNWLRAKPDFVNADYNTQLATYNKYLPQALSKEEAFMKTSYFSKLDTLEKYALFPPTLRNKDDLLAQENLNNIKTLNKLYENPEDNAEIIKKMEDNLIAKLNVHAANTGVVKDSGPGSAISKVGGGLINKLANTPLPGAPPLSDLEKARLASIGTNTPWSPDAEDINQYARISLKLGGNKEAKEAAWRMLGMLGTEATAFLAVRPAIGLGAEKTLSTIGKVGAASGRWAKAFDFMAKAAAGPGSAGAKSLATLGKSSRAASWALGTFVPWMADATLDGITGLTIEELSNITKGEGNTIFKEGFLNNLKTFGTYAAADYAFGVAASVLSPFFKLGGKVVKNTFNLKGPKIKGFNGTQEDLYKVLAGLKEPSPSQIKWVNEFAPGAGDLSTHNRMVQSFEVMGETALNDPLKNAWVTGSKLGNVIVPDGAGFRIRNMSDLSKVTKVDSVEDLTDYMLKQYQNASPVQIDHLKASNNKHGWLVNMNETFKRLDIPFGSKQLIKDLSDDSLLKKGLKSGEYELPSSRSKIHPLEYEQVLNSAKDSGINPIRGNLVKSADGNFHIVPDEAGKYVSIASSVASPDDYIATLAAAQKMGIDGVDIPKEKLADMLLVRSGVDTVQMADGSFRPLFQNKIKQLSDTIDLETGKVAKSAVVKQGPDIDEDILVKRTIKANIPEEAYTQTTKNLLDNTQDLRKVASQETVSRFMNDYFNDIGKKVDFSVKIGDSVKVDVVKGKLEITVPRNLHSIKERTKFIEKVMDAVNTMDGKVNLVSKIKASSDLTPNVAKKVDKGKFLKSIVKGSGGDFTFSDGKYVIKFKDGKTMSFTDVNTAYKAFLLNDMGEEILKSTLETAGYKVLTSEAGTKIIKDGEIILDTDKGFAASFMDSDIDLVKTPSIYEQNIAILDNNVNLQLESKVTLGSKNDTLKHFDKFADYHADGQLKVLSKQDKGSMLETLQETYEIRSNKYNYVKHFNHPRDARLFLENIDELENIFKMAEDKGLQISMKGDTFTVKGNGKEWTGKNADDVAAILRDSPSVASMPKIVDDPSIKAAMDQTSTIDAEFNEVMARNPEVYPIELPKIMDDYKKLGPIAHATMYSKLTTDWFVNAAQKVGDQNMVKLFTNFEDSIRYSQLQAGKYQDVVDTIFVDNKGKFFSIPERRAIYYLSTGADEGLIKKLTGDPKFTIKPEIKQASDRLRVVFNDLFQEMGVDGKKFLTDYLPKLRNYVHDNPGILNVRTGDELFKKVFHDNRPDELKVFFKQERATEVVRNLLNDDAYAVTQIYIERGMKQLYMDDAYKKLNGYMEEAAKAGLDPAFTHKMNSYFDSVMGFGNVEGVKAAEKVAKGFIDKILPKWAKANPGYSDDLIKNLITVNYVTSMGLKPFLGLRNLLQPWMTFAPRFGMDVTKNAYAEVAKNSGKIVKHLQDVGIIGRTTPLMYKLADNWIGKVANKALYGFKTSDEYTRAVAYQATKEMFDTGLDRLQKGLIDMDGFEKISGLNLLDNKSVINNVKALVAEGEFEGALNRYATQTIEETMFPYRPSQRPEFGGKSIFGKLFWQYGTYSAGYVSNVLRGFKNGNWAQKVGYVARLGVSSAVIGGTLKELGIRNSNFIPWTPMLFSGGPLLDTGFDIIQSFDTGYQGEQARARLKKFILPYKDKNGNLQFGTGMPFSYQIKNIQKGLKALEDGNTYLAWLNFTSTPVDPEYAENYQ